MWFQLSSMRCFPLDSPAANSMAISISLLAHSGTKQHTAHNTIATVCVVCTGVVYNFPFVYQLPFILWPFIASFWNFRYVCHAASCASRVPGPRGIGYVLFWGYGLRVTDYGLYQLRTNDATCRQQKRQTKGAGEVWLLAFDVACPGTAKNHKRKDSGSERLIWGGISNALTSQSEWYRYEL